jgi:hypothetical protein
MWHPREKRLRETPQQCYYHSKLWYTIDKFKCEHCQWHKLPGKGYGLLPEREMWIAPWEEVAIDLFGPWTVKVNNLKIEFNTLTCIDTGSNLVKLIRIDNMTSCHTRYKFVQSWFARYTRPIHCVHNKGGKFIGGTFQWLLHSFDIKDVQSTSKNLQSNSICKWLHQTVGNVLRVLLYSNPPHKCHRPETLAIRYWRLQCTPCNNSLHTRQHAGGSCIQLWHVLECPADSGLAHNSLMQWTVCQWQPLPHQQEAMSVWLCSRSESFEESAWSG